MPRDGRELPLKGGDEYDALTRWRRWLRWRPGSRKKAKRSYNRRWRREQRAEVERSIEEVRNGAGHEE